MVVQVLYRAAPKLMILFLTVIVNVTPLFGSLVTRAIRSVTGASTCKEKIYPTWSSLAARKVRLVKNQKIAKMVGLVSTPVRGISLCLPGPALSLCNTLLEISSLTEELFINKLVVDREFFKNTLFLDYQLQNEAAEKENKLYYIMSSLLQYRNAQVDEMLTSKKQVSTLFIGDSLMHIFESIPEVDVQFPKATFLGIGGDRTDMLLMRLFHQVLPLKPQKVVISVGGNDLIQECERKNIYDNRALIARILQEAGIEVYWVSLPPTTIPYWAKHMSHENEVLQSTVPGINYIDTYTQMADPAGFLKSEYRIRQNAKEDNIHFNEKAYDEVWIPQFKALGF